MKVHRNSIISILPRLTKGNSSTRLADPLATLSGGGRAVVRVLRSVIWRYKLLLFDEPLANVDAANRELLFDNLREHTPSEREDRPYGQRRVTLGIRSAADRPRVRTSRRR